MATAARYRRRDKNTFYWRTPLPLTSKNWKGDANARPLAWPPWPALLATGLLLALGGALLAPIGTARSTREGGRSRRPVPATSHLALAELRASRHDVVVVGRGPAGLAAALFAARGGRSVLVLGSPSAGSLAGAAALDNFPSFFEEEGGGGGGGGQGWLHETTAQAADFGARFAPPTLKAAGLARTQFQGREFFEVRLEGSEGLAVLGRTVVVASGSVPRRLGLPHEASLWGRAVHNCALCDGDAYARHDAKKAVAVVGGGDAAVEAVSLLHELGVSTIHWVHRRDEYRANSLELERVRQLSGVEVWTPYVVAEWVVKRGDGADAPLTLEGMRIVGAQDGNADPGAASSLTLPVDGAFLMIGSDPNSQWLRGSGVEIDPSSQLLRLAAVDKAADHDGSAGAPPPLPSTATSVPGIFAAGEAADGTYRQALTAAADGARAAIDAQRYLRRAGHGEAPRRKERAMPRRQRESARDRAEEGKAGPADCDLARPACIKAFVAAHPVVVFSKSYCPYCRRALEALRAFAEPLVVELDGRRDGHRVQDALEDLTGRRTVPNVFVGGKSIGRGDETTAMYREGTLGELVRKAVAASKTQRW